MCNILVSQIVNLHAVQMKCKRMVKIINYIERCKGHVYIELIWKIGHKLWKQKSYKSGPQFVCNQQPPSILESGVVPNHVTTSAW